MQQSNPVGFDLRRIKRLAGYIKYLIKALRRPKNRRRHISKLNLIHDFTGNSAFAAFELAEGIVVRVEDGITTYRALFPKEAAAHTDAFSAAVAAAASLREAAASFHEAFYRIARNARWLHTRYLNSLGDAAKRLNSVADGAVIPLAPVDNIENAICTHATWAAYEARCAASAANVAAANSVGRVRGCLTTLPIIVVARTTAVAAATDAYRTANAASEAADCIMTKASVRAACAARAYTAAAAARTAADAVIVADSHAAAIHRGGFAVAT